MTPKIIHYCWFGPKKHPKMMLECISSWHKHLPEYHFILWNEQNSPMDVPFVKQAYSLKMYAFVSDYVRFWALRNYGGIYLDTDMYVVKSFNTLLKDELFFAWENPLQNHISCGVIGSTEKNSAIEEILKVYDGIKITKDNFSNYVVPRIITPILLKSENLEKVKLHPFSFFYPFPYEDREKATNFKEYIKEDTYAVHLWNLSWFTWQLRLRELFKKYFRRFR